MSKLAPKLAPLAEFPDVESWLDYLMVEQCRRNVEAKKRADRQANIFIGVIAASIFVIGIAIGILIQSVL